MPALVLVLLLAAAIKDGSTPLRSGCSPDARVLASLPSGAPVTIKYSINAETGPCYKVSVEVEGKVRDELKNVFNPELVSFSSCSKYARLNCKRLAS